MSKTSKSNFKFSKPRPSQLLVLSILLHSLHLSTSPLSNRCTIGNFAKLPLENFLSSWNSIFPAFLPNPASTTIFPLPYQPTVKFSSSQSPSSSRSETQRTFSPQEILGSPVRRAPSVSFLSLIGFDPLLDCLFNSLRISLSL